MGEQTREEFLDERQADLDREEKNLDADADEYARQNTQSGAVSGAQFDKIKEDYKKRRTEEILNARAQIATERRIGSRPSDLDEAKKYDKNAKKLTDHTKKKLKEQQKNKKKDGQADTPCHLPPCDVQSLTLSELTCKKSLTCSKRCRHEMPPADAPQHLIPLLQSHDLVMELATEYKTDKVMARKASVERNIRGEVTGMSDFTDSEKDKKQPLKLWISAEAIGDCQEAKHIRIGYDPQSSSNGDTPDHWVGQSKTKELAAIATSIDSQGGILGFLRLLQRFWIFSEDYVKKIDIIADSCGRRDRGDPNTSLNALVRVYRKEIYKLELKISSLYGLSKSVGSRVKEDALGRHRKSESKVVGHKVYGKDDLVPLNPDKDDPGKLTLTVNGYPLEIVEMLNNLIRFQAFIKKKIEDIKKIKPQIGWSFGFDLSVFTGSIIGSWGTDFGKCGDRYLSVCRLFDLDFSIKVFEFKGEVSFGVDFGVTDVCKWFDKDSTTLFEVKLMASGSLSLCLSAQGKLIDHSQDNTSSEPQEIKINFTTNAEIKIEGKVNVLGIYYEAVAGIKGEIFDFEGKIQASFEQSLSFNGELFLKNIIAYATFKSNSTKDQHYSEIEVYPRTEITKF